MDVPTHDTIGLQIYRELIGRETRSVGTWEQTFGREALTKKKDPAAMVNLSTFDKAFAMPVPLEIQLKMMKESNREQNDQIAQFEANTFPFKATHAVSQASVGLYGDNAWHTQPKQESGAPAAVPEVAPDPRFKQRIWSVEREHYKYESMQPHHVNGRLKRLGEKS